MNFIFDTRWEDLHGIGRVTSELRRRVFSRHRWRAPRRPASSVNPVDPLVRGLELLVNPEALYYSPGFNPPMFGQKRAIFTIHDLIHLRIPEESGAMKWAYYNGIVRSAVASCFKVLTVSEYSRRDIIQWAGVDASAVVNVGNGVDERFFAVTEPFKPGFPYFFYIGARKPHKNLDRLLVAYSRSRQAGSAKLVLSGNPDPGTLAFANRLGIANHLVFAGRIPEADLPSYYQGALALLFPSTFEGFGLPPVEAMAGGVPVLVANTTSLPEVVGDAALMVDPCSIEAITEGINRITEDSGLRTRLAAAGPAQARRHSWDDVAARVNSVVDSLIASIKQ